MKKATDKHPKFIIGWIKITIKKTLEKHSKHKYKFSYLYFRCFFVDIAYIADRYCSSKTSMRAFKFLEKEWSFGLKSVSKMSQIFFNAYSNLEYNLFKAKSTWCFAFYKRREYRCYVPTRNTDSA